MKRMKETMAKQLIFALLLCGLFLFALPATDIVPFTDIAPAQAAAMIKAKSADPLFMILDVRTAGEFAENRINGAKNIDVKAPDFADRMSRLDKTMTYLVYCRGGVRSARAMNLMKEWGFKKVYNLGGGLMKWQAEKLPLETAARFREEKGREREE